jgi:hypothetical protein
MGLAFREGQNLDGPGHDALKNIDC